MAAYRRDNCRRRTRSELEGFSRANVQNLFHLSALRGTASRPLPNDHSSWV